MNDNIYEEILSRSNIVNIVEHYGIKVVKDKALCPFHKDSNPSLSVNRDKGIVKCFVCETGGNAISFIQKIENIGVMEAMQKAIDIQHLDIVIPKKDNKPLTPEQLKKQQLSNIMQEAIKFTKNTFKLKTEETNRAVEYLKSRNLSAKTVQAFNIGYAPKGNGIIENLQKQFKKEDLLIVGLAQNGNDTNLKNVFYERITIPIFDEYGNVVGFGARTINDNIKPKYLNTSATTMFEKSNILFNLHQAKSFAKNYELIVLEGYFDVISSKEMGIDNSVALMGTAITDEHIKKMKKLNCEVILALDNDEPGVEAMTKIVPKLINEGITVSIFNISSLGEYNDFGDLHMAGITNEQIYATKMAGFAFLIEQKYVKGNSLSVENISNIFTRMKNDNLIKNTKDELNFIDYVIAHTDYKKEEVENIIRPKELQEKNRVDRYRDTIFYYYIIKQIKNYAINNGNRVLLKFIELGKLNGNTMVKDLNNEEFLKDQELTINIAKYIKECILESEEYITFKNDKAFQFEDLLNNVKAFDEKGNVIDIKLKMEQKEIILKQYDKSFAPHIKEHIENSPDEFQELFIANSVAEYEKLFPERYAAQFKEESIKRFATDNTMGAVRYGLAYEENLKSVLSDKYVNNNQYKSLLVFNNINKTIEITEKNIKKEVKQEVEKKVDEKQEIVHENLKTAPMSIVMQLAGNEKETYKGIYLPVDERMMIYIPKQLYRIKNNELELISSQSISANMSEYEVDIEERKKVFKDRLTFKDFCDKYANLYKVKLEPMKEVVS